MCNCNLQHLHCCSAGKVVPYKCNKVYASVVLLLLQYVINLGIFVVYTELLSNVKGCLELEKQQHL